MKRKLTPEDRDSILFIAIGVGLALALLWAVLPFLDENLFHN